MPRRTAHSREVFKSPFFLADLVLGCLGLCCSFDRWIVGILIGTDPEALPNCWWWLLRMKRHRQTKLEDKHRDHPPADLPVRPLLGHEGVVRLQLAVWVETSNAAATSSSMRMVRKSPSLQ